MRDIYRASFLGERWLVPELSLVGYCGLWVREEKNIGICFKRVTVALKFVDALEMTTPSPSTAAEIIKWKYNHGWYIYLYFSIQIMTVLCEGKYFDLVSRQSYSITSSWTNRAPSNDVDTKPVYIQVSFFFEIICEYKSTLLQQFLRPGNHMIKPYGYERRKVGGRSPPNPKKEHKKLYNFPFF